MLKVLVTGVFDLLHSEHILFLEKAKEIGDWLILGIESDIRVRAIKGLDRPVESQDVRLLHIQELEVVDEADILPEDFDKESVREAFILRHRPNILAVSSHSPHQENKRKLIEKYGGKLVVVHTHNPKVSTTLHISKRAEKKHY